MPIARITVTAVSDEGDNVIVWGRPEQAPDDSELVGFTFQAKGERVDVALAERASRLACGVEANIDYALQHPELKEEMRKILKNY